MPCQVTSFVSDFATLRLVACQAPLSIRFSRQEYWRGLPCPSAADLPNPGFEPASLKSLALAEEFYALVPPGKPSILDEFPTFRN